MLINYFKGCNLNLHCLPQTQNKHAVQMVLGEMSGNCNPAHSFVNRLLTVLEPDL